MAEYRSSKPLDGDDTRYWWQVLEGKKLVPKDEYVFDPNVNNRNLVAPTGMKAKADQGMERCTCSLKRTCLSQFEF